MNEINFLINLREIAMIKDFMEKGCGIHDINLQWTDELKSLLESIGHIVCTPEFEEEVWKGHVKPLPKVPKS